MIFNTVVSDNYYINSNNTTAISNFPDNLIQVLDGYQTEMILLGITQIPKSCVNCPNHPLNGGSGVCHCILGLPQIT